MSILVVITEDPIYSALALYTLAEVPDVLILVFWCSSKTEMILHDSHLTFTTSALSLAPSPFLSVCQIGFMYLIYLGEWATVETKAQRHILLASTLF